MIPTIAIEHEFKIFGATLRNIDGNAILRNSDLLCTVGSISRHGIRNASVIMSSLLDCGILI
jgi:hypothetical protein